MASIFVPPRSMPIRMAPIIYDVMRPMTSASVAVIVITLSAPTQTRSAEPQFRFQNNFWVNLHHVLRGDARRGPLKLPLAVKPEELSEAERAAWSAALDTYAPLGSRDLLFDADLEKINSALALVTDNEILAAPSLDPNIAATLTRAAPVYRAHLWTTQKRINDDWIAAVRPDVDRHASRMAAALAKVYRIEWPASPIIVDAAAEAGPGGGYTINGPPGTAAHVVIEAGNSSYQGDMAFEMLFHEASHASAIGRPIITMIAAAAEKQHVTPHPDLWHTLIFYTTGELARRELGKGNDPNYKPYAYRYGVYDRRWLKLRDALEKHWQPYLDGKTEFDAALAGLVRDATSQ